ncbi:alpha/beta fold hydrolase [Mycolicibacterium porcinum]|uniref:Alpha/beta hydrolase n=1 Tax=Mycolicibacterium porcinum TaxID=39693 RepID=A0AAW5T3T2_9MYCO|nr:alpha/beta hydrolase [Mycolicibacterium porcinum]MCV7389253.1 alpha/beta hydrolase [Mycolicibacterium porcinum]ORB44764.1 alpha/beta hydrolase [Mycolicibacterium porcinum]CDO27834.1 alpha/beta hydrolase [Mycolicibacterium vulneris]
MTASTSLSTHILEVPGARLHYEVRGAGPLLLILGAPMAAAEFAPLAHALAGDHTVVTADPRGIAGSSVDDPTENSIPERRADDVAAILDDLGAPTADVFGSSGGAVTGLSLVARHPGRVRTLVAHEPPLLELLPDAAAQRAATEDIIATFNRDGMFAAWGKFMANAGFDIPTGAPEMPEPSDQDLRDAAHFFNHQLRSTTRFLPDIQALKRGRVVVGLGEESGRLLTKRTTIALAELLGTRPVMFPGDHGGFMGAPGAFAEVLRKALRG